MTRFQHKTQAEQGEFCSLRVLITGGRQHEPGSSHLFLGQMQHSRTTCYPRGANQYARRHELVRANHSARLFRSSGQAYHLGRAEKLDLLFRREDFKRGLITSLLVVQIISTDRRAWRHGSALKASREARKRVREVPKAIYFLISCSISEERTGWPEEEERSLYQRLVTAREYFEVFRTASCPESGPCGPGRPQGPGGVLGVLSKRVEIWLASC